ncbi:DMT family transporter [Alginatibacterium sediminis]|uniref:DMT family transporter n=1 Tax=Alginatibacterium sediminis TaxID=2164068 RepID=A0A420EE12_9ALTE|nr:DMT family transporter [Alginatibacterium sediminis]RKF18894.1 DMT family transporter [Alginatibacterium sediminis]
MKPIQVLFALTVTALAPIVWGSTYIVTTELLPSNIPLTAALLRALPAGMVLVLITRTKPQGQWWGKLAILGLLNIGFFFYCLFFAATHLPGGMAALVMAISPILVITLNFLLNKSPLSLNQGLASVLGVVGIALLVLNNQAALDLSGVVMGLLGAFSMALGMVLTKRWNRPTDMNLLGFTGWQLLFGGLMLLPVSLWFEGLPRSLSLNNMVGYAYLTIVGSMIAYSLWFRGLEKLPTVTVSFLGLLSSVSAVALGYFILGESLTIMQFVGAMTIFVSIVLASTASKPRPIVKADKTALEPRLT